MFPMHESHVFFEMIVKQFEMISRWETFKLIRIIASLALTERESIWWKSERERLDQNLQISLNEFKRFWQLNELLDLVLKSSNDLN